MDKYKNDSGYLNTSITVKSETGTKPGEHNYWRSFGELHNDPEFNEAKQIEFGKDVTSDFDTEKLSTLSRRKFLALLSASAAFAAAGCANYRDKGEIVPYNQKPEEITPGIPNYYASTCDACNNACGILIKTREGRPIKVDGNPDHPVNRGKICVKGQANVLNLYDPSRLKDPMYSKERMTYTPTSWADADEKIINELKAASAAGKEIAIVTHSVLSPTLKKLLDDFTNAYPTTKIYSYELFGNQPKQDAWKKCYGKDTLPVIEWEKAKVIVALESDFLGTEGNVMEQTRAFTSNRDVNKAKEFNRLYAIEGGVTLTGLNADYRIRLRPDAIEEFVLGLLNEFLIVKKISSYSGDTKIIESLKPYGLKGFITKYGLQAEAADALVADLLEHREKSIVIAGNSLPETTHIAVNFLNEVLGNSLLYKQNKEEFLHLPLVSRDDMDTLIDHMVVGTTTVVIHLDTNPVYHFSRGYDYRFALRHVKLVVTISESENDTSVHSDYVLPSSHTFESWGDYKKRTGIYSLQQPVIAPLYRNRQKEAILLTWIKGNKEAYNEKIYHEYLMQNWEKNIFPLLNKSAGFKTFWYSALHNGVVEYDEKSDASYTFSVDAFLNGTGKVTASNGYVVKLEESCTLGDGRFANNGWLQELPHPVSKIVWDNYAAVSIQTASQLGVNTNDLLDVSVGGVKITIPAFIQPGMADNVIQISLGYGRLKTGEVGRNVGVNANALIYKRPALTDHLYNNAVVTKAAGTYELISTQEHHAFDTLERLKDAHLKREIVIEGTLEEYKANPRFLEQGREEVKLFNIAKDHKYESYKWGMSIDLNKCTGCGACSVACSAENNIPVVGKDQVKVNREMMWIRIDRYYSGSPDSPRASFQPMLCQHCDNAPCENVCPVAATNHSPDGLNQMAYNRCVGTRYCSNNCPYKVRRFNFFDFRDHFKDSYYTQEPISLLYNPEATVRSRGVMEKCTFCVQRIMDERQHAIQENRTVNGNNVKTACQEACPAYAIEFGDINDDKSTVSQNRKHNLSYNVLEWINVRPNVTYLAKLRNINKEKS